MTCNQWITRGFIFNHKTTLYRLGLYQSINRIATIGLYEVGEVSFAIVT